MKAEFDILIFPIWLDFYFEDFGVRDLQGLLEFLEKE